MIKFNLKQEPLCPCSVLYCAVTVEFQAFVTLLLVIQRKKLNGLTNMIGGGWAYIDPAPEMIRLGHNSIQLGTFNLVMEMQINTAKRSSGKALHMFVQSLGFDKIIILGRSTVQLNLAQRIVLLLSKWLMVRTCYSSIWFSGQSFSDPSAFFLGTQLDEKNHNSQEADSNCYLPCFKGHSGCASIRCVLCVFWLM